MIENPTAITVKKSISKLAVVAIILALAAVGLSGYLYYIGIEYKRSAEMQLGVIAVQDSAQAQQNQALMSNLQDSVEKVSAKLNEVSGNKSGLIIFQMNELISMANQDLIIYNDVPGSIRLLSHAQKIIETSGDAVFTGLKVALATDLSKLNGLVVVDKAMLNGELNDISNEISDLHIQKINKEVDSKTNVNASAWNKFINNVKNSLLGFVSVSSSNSAQNDFLLPKDEIILKDDILLDLLNAKVALLEHDQISWELSLNHAKTLVSKGLTNYDGVAKLNAKLNNLISLKVNNANADIDATLAQLVKLNNLQ